MAVIIRNNAQLQEAKETLEDLKRARKKILVGGQSYAVGGNQMNRVGFAEVSREIEAYETAIDAYEAHGSTKRRTVRAVPLG